MQFKFSVTGEILSNNFKIVIFKNDIYEETKDMILEKSFLLDISFL